MAFTFEKLNAKDGPAFCSNHTVQIPALETSPSVQFPDPLSPCVCAQHLPAPVEVEPGREVVSHPQRLGISEEWLELVGTVSREVVLWFQVIP